MFFKKLLLIKYVIIRELRGIFCKVWVVDSAKYTGLTSIRLNYLTWMTNISLNVESLTLIQGHLSKGAKIGPAIVKHYAFGAFWGKISRDSHAVGIYY